MKTPMQLTLALIVAIGAACALVLAPDAAIAGGDIAQDTPIVLASAEDGGDEPVVKGSDKKGKYWFKKTCKSCHTADGDGGEVTPMTKTIKQWERYFRRDKHLPEQKLSEGFDAEQIIHIRTFLINHAADSDQPETCG